MSKPKAAPNTGTEAVSKIVKSGREIHGKMMEGRTPSMKFPLRSLYVMDTYLPAKLRQPEKFLPQEA